MGQQIWLIRADGTEARYLTSDPNMHHAFPRWTSDGRAVTFQSFPLKELGARPNIWLLEVDTGQTRQLSEAAGRSGCPNRPFLKYLTPDFFCL
jgi:TolB protein